MDSQAEDVVSLEEYVNTHVPERFRHWLLHQRGYADRFEWTGPDREIAKREKEQSIVINWAQALFRNEWPYVAMDSCSPPLPDCQLINKCGEKIGVEVTELVDEATIVRNKHTSYHWKEYSAAELIAAVRARLDSKNQKLRRARATIIAAGFSKIIVIMHCDEPDLRSRVTFSRSTLSSIHFPRFTEIDEAFLLLPCRRKRGLQDLEAEFCQPIQIPLEGRKPVVRG